LQSQLENQNFALLKLQNQSKIAIERLPAIQASDSLSETIKTFLKDK
jgi:hypothetical protein